MIVPVPVLTTPIPTIGGFGGVLGQNWGVWRKFGSYHTYYGIPCAKARRFMYYMPKMILGHLGAKLGDLGEFGGKLGQMTLTTALLSPRRVV